MAIPVLGYVEKLTIELPEDHQAIREQIGHALQVSLRSWATVQVDRRYKRPVYRITLHDAKSPSAEKISYLMQRAAIAVLNCTRDGVTGVGNAFKHS